jgi:hypothetical protein
MTVVFLRDILWKSAALKLLNGAFLFGRINLAGFRWRLGGLSGLLVEYQTLRAQGNLDLYFRLLGPSRRSR